MRRLAFRRAPAEYDREFMERMAGAYRDRTPWTELRLAAVRDLVGPAPGERVLDLGCAAGTVTHFMSTLGCDLVGVDAEPIAIETARSLFPELTFVQADVRDLPFPDESFHKAVAADLVEHLEGESLAGMLAAVWRVLVPGGTLSIYTPNPAHPIERLKARDLILARNATHVGLREAPALEAALAGAGFVVDRSEWRPSFYRGLRVVEGLAGRRFVSFRYRLCLRGRKLGRAE